MQTVTDLTYILRLSDNEFELPVSSVRSSSPDDASEWMKHPKSVAPSNQKINESYRILYPY